MEKSKIILISAAVLVGGGIITAVIISSNKKKKEKMKILAAEKAQQSSKSDDLVKYKTGIEKTGKGWDIAKGILDLANAGSEAYLKQGGSKTSSATGDYKDADKYNNCCI